MGRVRALRFSRSGDPRALVELVELPEPEVGPGEVLVEVLASPVGPMDRLSLRGLYPLATRDGIPGAQGVGLVVEQGEGVEEPEVGSVVLLPARVGAWRERLVLPGMSLVPIAAERDPVLACTLRIEALTAALLIADVPAGGCFIHSPGAGSVGRYLTILARQRGLHNIALVSSSEPIADLWGLGADEVLVREPGLAGRLANLGLPLPTIGFDGSGGAVSSLLASCLEPGGELVVYGAMSRQPITLGVDQLVFRDIKLRGFWLHRWAQEVGEAKLRAELLALSKLELSEHVVARFTLDQWSDALALAERSGARGRVVFTPALSGAPPS